MNNFGRALRLAMRYPVTLGSSVLCALMVALLWGGNISTVYPLVEVTTKGRSLQQWAAEAEAHCTKNAERFRSQADDVARQLKVAAADRRDALVKKEQYLRQQAELELKGAGRYAWLAQHLIDPYFPNDPFVTLTLVVGALLAGTVIKSGFFVAQQILVARLSQRVVFNLRKEFYRRTLRMDLKTFTNEGTSELMSRFTFDMESLSTGLNDFFGKLIREPMKMLTCLVGAACVCWQLLLLSLVVAPLSALLIRWLARSLKRANRKAMEEMSQIYNILDETFQGVKVVKAFTMERSERWRFHMVSKKYLKKAMRIARYDSLTRPVTEVMGMTTVCVALLAGAYLVLEQKNNLFGIPMGRQPPSFEGLLLFYGLLAGVSDPARKLSEVFSRIQRASAASDRIYQLLDREPRIVDARQGRPLVRHRRELLFERVNFHYQPSQRVLENVDLRIAFGETIAIVGPNGCGKSTLANLIPRFFDPVSGSVRLDGIDLRDVRLRDLRSQIGLVTQETLLFDDTVLANIRYGSPSANRDDVVRAAQRAHAHRFIEEKLQSGYNTVVGQRGNLLSGGQRQRIALARAILRDPSLLILDEATSQVDLESEQVIQQVLEQFVRNRTTVIITHRMGTLALADRIVVMEAGRILDVGTHDDLLRRCSLYGRLHDIQFKEIA
ncbi:MAG TPA: ABC transporter ATP-binding protein [Pirellulales bacterium]|jgi:ATP-binding cassette subfamily B protein/subfamily B ATP-binding cassette protein MsbA|nr:ABC transporter ATP-binding protein [Pirellulales bacterium]